MNRNFVVRRRSCIPSGVLYARICRGVTILGLTLSTFGGAQAQINLDVSHGAIAGQIILTWSGGSTPYNLYMGDSGDMSGGGVERLLTNSTSTSYTTSASGNLIFFRVGDSTAPQVTITSPGSSVTAGHVSVLGNTSVAVSSVWVNRRQSQVAGTSFTANDVLLVLGDNTLRAAALTSDENVFIATSQVTRQPGNDPPILTILSPADGSQVWDVTPVVQVTYSDTTGLNPANFRGYLDGIDQTSKFTLTASGASWQIAGTDVLEIGTHVLRVTIQDADGFTQGSSSQFRVSGPRLDSISPRKVAFNTLVTIVGEGFGTTADTQVFFGGIAATTISSISPTQIQARVPVGATDGSTTVKVSGVASNPLPFDVVFNLAGGASTFMAVDVNDRIYYTDIGNHTIIRMNQDGTGLFTFFSTADEINGIAFDPAGTTLYVSARGAPAYDDEGLQYVYLTGRIHSIDQNGTATLRFVLDPLSLPRFSDPGGLDVKPPFVYVGATQPEVTESVLRLDLNNPGSRPVLFNFPLSDWILGDLQVDSAGNIYTIYSASGPYTPTIYKGQGIIYQLGTPGEMTIDCLDRVLFTDFTSGEVRRLVNFQSSVLLSTTAAGPYGIDLDSKGNVFVATPSGVYRATGTNATIVSCANDFPVSLAGDSAKVLADFDPIAGIETPNSQYVVLMACLGDPTIPRLASDRVYWTFEDVDDPSTSTDLDPNGTAGNDNIGDMDQSPPFTQESSFTLTVGGPGPFQYATTYGTVGANICSKIRFHPSDAPGDNFIVGATLRTKIGDRSVMSKTMTTWKRVHVTLDSMGEVQGIIDSDDAVVGDIPDPAPEFVASAFSPAYIEIINDGPGATTNVTFDDHVPDIFTFDTDPGLSRQIRDQGALGRESVNASSSGGWKIYAQNAYEGFSDRDNDPDTDLQTLGITNSLLGKYSLVFVETIRDFADGIIDDEGYFRAAVTVHELAHQFGIDDEDQTSNGSGGIMEGQSNFKFPYFNARQLRAIREIGQANNFPSRLE